MAGRCGEWPEDLASASSLEGWDNQTYWNFGCANQTTLSAQIDDPRDLVAPRGQSPLDIESRMRAIGNVRKGADPSTEWSVKGLEYQLGWRQLMKEQTAAAEGDAATQIAPVPRISVQAFCETPDAVAVVEFAAVDRRMDKAHVKVHMGGVAAAIEAFRSAPTPNLIVLESIDDAQMLISQLETLSESCDSGTKVVVLGHVNDISLYRALMSRGVSDYIVAPIDVLGFIARISDLYNIAPSRSDASSRSSAPRAASAPPASRIISPGRSRALCRCRPSSPISIFRSARRGSISIRIRRRASRKRCSRRIASTPISSTDCCRNAAIS